VKTVEDYDKELDARRKEKVENEDKTPEELGLRIVEETEVHSVVCGFEVILTASNLAKVLSIPNEGFYYTCGHNKAKKSEFLKIMTRLSYVKGKSCESDKIDDLKPTQRVLAKIMLSSIFPSSESSDKLTWDHRHFSYFLSRKYDLNWAEYIFKHLCKAVLSTQNQDKPIVNVIYPRILSEIFYQCGVIDIIKAAGHDCLLREIRASTVSVHTFSHMNLLSGHEVQPSDPLVPQSHSEPSLVKKCNIDIPTTSSGIINQYIQLLDNLGEGFEIEEEEVKKKRRRTDEAASEERHSDSKGHREGSS